MIDLNNLETFCTDRSDFLRPLKNDVRWLIHLAGGQLPAGAPPLDEEQRSTIRKRMHAVLGDEIRHRCGNPLVAWMFLKIVLPIVVKLVMQWWLSQKE